MSLGYVTPFRFKEGSALPMYEWKRESRSTVYESICLFIRKFPSWLPFDRRIKQKPPDTELDKMADTPYSPVFLFSLR
jgi:hypothetical protein